MKAKLFLISMAICLMSFVSDLNERQNDVISKFSESVYTRFGEKLFIHFDRPLYFAGDEIWFQSYLVNAINHLPNTYEQILYLEMINPQGVVVAKKMFKLNNGKCHGHLKLSDSLVPGNYLFVAYTNWMRNQGAEFFYKQEISILSEQQSIDEGQRYEVDNRIKDSDNIEAVSVAQQPKVNLNLKFYPEGGDLIEGVFSRIAFEGLNQAGKPMDFQGKIVDEKGVFYTMIKPLNKGKGFFFLIPKADKKYFAVIEGNNAEELKFKLPQVKLKGFHLSVENRYKTDSLEVRVSSKGLEGNDEVVLFAQQDGLVKNILKGKLSHGKLNFRIDKEGFNTGIVQFTIFDKQMQPHCERLVFVNHHDELRIEVENVPDELKQREKVDLQLKVTDKSGNPVQGEFSVAVTDANMIGEDAYGESNLLNHMLLGANLPGKIEGLEELLQNKGTSHASLDLLMLVNGWRRYKWKDILIDSIPQLPYALEKGIFVEGTLRRKTSKKTAPKGIKVTMLLNKTGMGGYSTYTDENGQFAFNIPEFNDTVSVLVQTENRLKAKADFSIELESNLRFEAVDFNARQLMQEEENVPTTFFVSEEIKEGEVVAVKGSMREEYKRLAEVGFFQDTTDILFDDIEIRAKKKRNSREQMTEDFGAPNYVMGQRQIEDLIKEKPWFDGLVTLLYDAIPGLRVWEVSASQKYKRENDGFSSGVGDELIDSLSSSETDYIALEGNDRTVEFSLTKGGLHRFYIFVDGELVGLTDAKGVLTGMVASLNFDDFINMDPLAIKTIELIVNPKESPQYSLFSDDIDELYTEGGLEAILSIYTKSGGGIFSRSYNKGMTNFRIFGFEKTKEFYSPDYDQSIKNKIVKDERVTLYWNSLIKTNEQGKASVRFYNSDVASKLRFDIAGFSSIGTPGAIRCYRGVDDLPQNLSKVPEETSKYDSSEETGESAASKRTEKIKVLTKAGGVVPYADIIFKDSGKGLVANKDGVFVMDKDEVSKNSVLIISSPLFGSNEVVVQDDVVNGKIVLDTNIEKSNENIDAQKIINQVIRKSKVNTPNKAYYIKGAYREMVCKGRELYGLSDFSVIQKKESYYQYSDVHASMPLSGRVFRTEDYRMKIKYKPLSVIQDMVPVLDPLHQDLPFFSADYKKQYEYHFDGVVIFQGKEMYKIKFDQKDNVSQAFYIGYMLVDATTYAIAYLEWQRSKKGEKYEIPQMFLMPGEEVHQFTKHKDRNIALFQVVDGKSYLKYAQQFVDLSVNNDRLSFTQEFSLEEVLPAKPEGFKQRDLEQVNKRRTLIKEVKYDPGFWRNPSVLPSNKEIEEQVQHLHEVSFYKQVSE